MTRNLSLPSHTVQFLLLLPLLPRERGLGYVLSLHLFGPKLRASVEDACCCCCCWKGRQRRITVSCTRHPLFARHHKPRSRLKPKARLLRNSSTSRAALLMLNSQPRCKKTTDQTSFTRQFTSLWERKCGVRTGARQLPPHSRCCCCCCKFGGRPTPQKTKKSAFKRRQKPHRRRRRIRFLCSAGVQRVRAHMPVRAK